MNAPLPAYAELHCLSHFSFGRGASSALELFERAQQQGYTALAITDECTLEQLHCARGAAAEAEMAQAMQFGVRRNRRSAFRREALRGKIRA